MVARPVGDEVRHHRRQHPKESTIEKGRSLTETPRAKSPKTVQRMRRPRQDTSKTAKDAEDDLHDVEIRSR